MRYLIIDTMSVMREARRATGKKVTIDYVKLLSNIEELVGSFDEVVVIQKTHPNVAHKAFGRFIEYQGWSLVKYPGADGAVRTPSSFDGRSIFADGAMITFVLGQITARGHSAFVVTDAHEVSVAVRACLGSIQVGYFQEANTLENDLSEQFIDISECLTFLWEQVLEDVKKNM